MTSPINGQQAGLTRAAKQQELEWLLHSGVVRGGTHAYAILTYLGRRAIEGRSEPLKEYTIGVDALSKPEGYDPRLDPTVRVEVGRLRGRLREYYAGEGAGRAIRLEIPKGGYTAEFARKSDAMPQGRAARWLAVALGLVMIGWGLWLVRPRTPAAPLSPELRAFWKPHLDGRRPTLLVYGAPLFLKLDGSYFRDPHVNVAPQIPASESMKRVLEALHPSEQRPVHHFTGFGEAEAMFRLTRLLAGAGASVAIRRSNTVSWDEMKREHVILLGGRKFNPQIPELPYPYKYEAVPRRIVNRKLKPGEPREYTTVSKEPHGELTEEHALISVYPGMGPETRLIILDCSSSEGTAAAGEFLTREDMVGRLRAAMGGWPSGKAFQVVLKTKLRGAVPVSLDYVTHAVLE